MPDQIRYRNHITPETSRNQFKTIYTIENRFLISFYNQSFFFDI